MQAESSTTQDASTTAPNRRVAVAAWSATALVALAPFHAIGPDIGITLKPWIIALVVGLAAAGGALVTAFRDLPITVRIAVVLMGIGGIASIFVSADPARTFRHVAALGLAAAAILLVVAIKDIPYLGVAIRFGAIAMGVFSLVEALLVMSSTAAVSTLEAGTALTGSLAEIVYGDIVVVSGTHFDSNFASVYAAAWAFLLFAYPAERFFNKWTDGVVLGLLFTQLVLTQSKTGTIGLVAAVALTVLVAFFIKGRPLARPSLIAAIVVAVASLAVVAAADATDGSADLAHGIEKRTRQLEKEMGRFGVLLSYFGFGGEGDEVDEEDVLINPAQDRSSQWRLYIEDFAAHPLTGVGMGVPSKPYGYAHNSALEAAGGAGILGVTGWVLLWVGTVLALVNLLRRHPHAVPLVGAITVIAVASMLLSMNYEVGPAIVMGLILAPAVPKLAARSSELAAS